MLSTLHFDDIHHVGSLFFSLFYHQNNVVTLTMTVASALLFVFLKLFEIILRITLFFQEEVEKFSLNFSPGSTQNGVGSGEK